MLKAFADSNKFEKVVYYCFLKNDQDLNKLKRDLPENVLIRPLFFKYFRDKTSEGRTLGSFLYKLFYTCPVNFLRSFLLAISLDFKKDKVFLRASESLFAFWLASFLKKIPYVFELHNYEFGKNRMKDFFFQSFMSRASKIVTISKYTKENWVKHDISENKIIVLPSGVDVEKFALKSNESKKILRKELGIPINRKIVFYNGSKFHAWKGIDMLISSFEYIQDQNVWLYLIGGTKPDVIKYKNLANDLGIQNIVFKGYLPHDQMPKYIKAADVCVIPNTGKQDISRYHTSPIKLFEYMASQVPVAAADLPSIKQFVSEEEVTFFQADDSNDLAKKINFVLNNQDQVVEKVGKAFSRVQDYSWQKRADKIIDLLM